MADDKRAIRLLMGPEVPIQRVVQQLPSQMDGVTGNFEHLKRGILKEKTRVPAFCAWVVTGGLQNLQSRFAERQSALAESVEGFHGGVIGKKNDSHTKLLNLQN